VTDRTSDIRALIATADIHFGRDHPSAAAIRRAAVTSDREVRKVLGALPSGLERWLLSVYEAPATAAVRVQYSMDNFS
jgi:hypothetical protein